MARKMKTGLARYFEFASLSPAEDGSDKVLEIPEDLSTLSDDEVKALAAEASTYVSTVYGGGANALTDEDLQTLEVLTEGLQALAAETAKRDEDAEERRKRAEELIAKAGLPTDDGSEDDDEEEEAEEESTEEAPVEETPAEQEQEQAQTQALNLTAAAARKPLRVNLSSIQKHLPKSSPAEDHGAKGIRDVLSLSASVSGFRDGAGLDWDDAGKALSKVLERTNINGYAAAAKTGKRIVNRSAMFTINKPIADEFVVTGQDGSEVEQVLSRAVQGKTSLVASGGWCAPSETVYDLLELETRDGIFSLPEVQLKRGGIRRTLGPKFSEIYDAAKGWHSTEQQDIDGMYGVDAQGIGNGTEGTKPCFDVPCPAFEDIRLDIDGLCVTSGILQAHGYPEAIARFIRGVYVAHDHKIAGRMLADIAAESQAVNFTAEQAGTTAPILTAVELRAYVLRAKNRMGLNATLEAVFPNWVHGAIRADLARRLGVDLLDVTDQRINAWFAARNISAQFVYNWQDLATDASVVAYPNKVEFLLYPAGTWIKGTNSLVTIENLYDSDLLAENNYQALWTEEGAKVIRMGHESDRVIVPITVDGATHMGVDIAHNGTVAVTAPAA